MNKKNLTIFLVIVVLAALVFITAPKTIEYQKNQDQRGEEIFGEEKVGQTFFSIDKNLQSINVKLSNFNNRPNDKNVIFHLKEDSDSEDIRTVTINASEIKDGEFHRFAFNTVKDSNARGFFFLIESPESTSGNAITYLFNSQDNYSSGNMFVNGEVREGDLAFSATYRDSMFVRLIKNPLQIILLIVGVIILWIILSRVFKEREYEEDEEE